LPPWTIRRAAEFAAPDDERLIEQAALLEILDEGGAGLVDVEAVLLQIGGQVAVLVPRLVEELDEADPALDQAAAEQAVVGEGALARLRAVHRADAFRLQRDVGDFRRDVLHAEGHLKGGDAGLDLGIADRFVALVVEEIHRVDGPALGFAGDAFRVGEIEDGIAGGVEGEAVVDGGQEARGPVRIAAGRALETGGHDHEGRQVGVLRTEAVGHPGAERGPAELLGPGGHQDLRRGVVEGVRVHRADERDVIRMGADVRQDLRHLHAALAVMLEGELGAQELISGVSP
jgi:hypothetical protein